MTCQGALVLDWAVRALMIVAAAAAGLTAACGTGAVNHATLAITHATVIPMTDGRIWPDDTRGFDPRSRPDPEAAGRSIS
jgi:hypothetical protein